MRVEPTIEEISAVTHVANMMSLCDFTQMFWAWSSS